MAGNTATQSSVPVTGCPRDEAGEGCAGWGGGGVGLRPLQETRVLRPLTPGHRSGRPEGSEEGQQTTRECAGSGASQDSGVQGFWCGTGWGRGPERRGGPRGGLSSQQGRSEGGAGRGGTAAAGPPRGHTWEPPPRTHMGTSLGMLAGLGCLQEPPGDAGRLGCLWEPPGDTCASPSSLCSGVALSPICSQLHHILHASENRPSQGDARGRLVFAPPLAQPLGPGIRCHQASRASPV